MGGSIQLTADLAGLEKIRKGLKTDLVAKIGVFGSHAARTGKSPITNTELAVVMIFGSLTKHIPARDFLKMPIEFRRADLMKAAASEYARKFILNGDAEGLLAYLAVKGEEYIQDAFESRGYGQWAPNAPLTIRLKGSSAPLIDTAALRKSITSTVEKA